MSSVTPDGRSLWRILEQAAEDPVISGGRRARSSLGWRWHFPNRATVGKYLHLWRQRLHLVGLGGCDPGEPSSTLIPAVKTPPNIIPGVPNFYATAHVLDGYASGIVVNHNMGRPTKVDGNPRHPASLGATDVFAQAQVLEFYDPDRAAEITFRGEPSDRQNLDTAVTAQRPSLAENMWTAYSNGHQSLLRRLRRNWTSCGRRYPEARWHQWDPVSRDGVRDGAVLAPGGR